MGEPSIFSLVERSLDDPDLEYVAISYAWGTEDHTASLTLRGEAGDEILKLTPSAYEAITTIVSTPDLETGVLYWMDQICIDQQNDAEKSQQVQMMGDIFQRAWRTVIWLGPEDEDTAPALSLLEEVERIIPSNEPGPVKLEMINQTHERIREIVKAWYGADILPPTDHPGWRALLRLLRRQWFSRLWTFQEAVLSSATKQIICLGSRQAPLIVLIKVVLLLGFDPRHGIETTRSRSALYDIAYFARCHVDKKPVSLFRLLKTNEDHDCGDPRDRIYALLGMVNEAEASSITVDYSIPVTSLYKDIARRVIRSQQSLRIAVEAPERNAGGIDLDLPSWVCNWTCGLSVSSIEYFDSKVAYFKASLGFKYEAGDDDGDRLEAKGRVVDAVREVIHTPQWNRKVDLAEQRSQLLSQMLPAVYSALQKECAETDDASRIQKLVKTLTADGYTRDVTRNTDWPSDAWAGSTCKKMFELMLRSPESCTKLDGFEERWMALFVTQCDHVVHRRRLAFLKDFGLAVVPWDAEVGDAVAILHGSSMPVILRKVEDEDAYRMIGICFVDGMMYGERVDWAEEDADVINII